jgi:organic hydroperoxide reductase OsmC/OhrA
MWKYNTTVAWKSGKEGSLQCEGKPEVPVATPPEFGGPKDIWTPEDLLTGAVASCVMTSLLFFAEKAGIKMRSYTSRATGTMEKTPQGLAITGVAIEVAVGLGDPGQEPAIRKAMERAEQTCPVSRSLKCPVALTLQVTSEQ